MILLLGISPLAKLVFHRVYFPAVRVPNREIPINLLSLFTVCVLVIFLYACTGGGVAYLATGHSPSRPVILASAAMGAIMFTAGRLWALTESLAFAQGLYFSCILSFSACIGIGIIEPGKWTEFTDIIWKRNVDDFYLAPIALMLATASLVVTEGLFGPTLRLLPQATKVPFALSREHFEVYEQYSQISGKGRILERIKNELSHYAASASGESKKFSVFWMTGNAAPEVAKEIKFACREFWERSKKADAGAPEKEEIFILSHDSKENQMYLRNWSMSSARFHNTNGSYRLLILGNSTAFLGVQIGNCRQAMFPDYMLVIKEPTRIAELRNLFLGCWDGASH